jgi:eukaryotic-like serine/threonine-protein kinase
MEQKPGYTESLAMKSERWQKLDELLHSALELDGEARAAFLAKACDRDAELGRELESMLAHHHEAQSFMESSHYAVEAESIANNDSPTLIGKTVGRYEIRAKIGAGGMGEVYLAKDTRLHRKVALKILPVELASNQDRMRRFEQEATAAAALNHPNIAHIYEIGTSPTVSEGSSRGDETHFIAMEFIEGETLSEKIHRDRVPLAKLLKYLSQVAEGLAKAHAAGIVHRDLKPDNVMITRDDYAKILDFGLAKLIEPQRTFGETGSSEIATAVMPQRSIPGMVMGTLGYMSPEQASGRVKEIDQRSDVFSYGCILFEAATGQKAFAGKDVLDSLHKIVHAPTPQIKDFNASAPDELQRIVRRCLAKEADKRYQSIKDVAIELEELRQVLKDEAASNYSVRSLSSLGPTAASAGAQTGGPAVNQAAVSTASVEATRPPSSAEYIVTGIKQHKAAALIVIALLALASIGYGIYKYYGSQKRNAASLSQMKPILLTTTGNTTAVAISPDGKTIIYSSKEGGQESLWMRQTATQNTRQIVAPARIEYTRLIFSPDGNFLFYLTRAKDLYRISTLGGTPKKLLADVSSVGLSPDGSQIAYVRAGEGAQSLMISNIDGSAERPLAVRKPPERTFRGGVGPRSSAWSPDGKTIVCPVDNRDGGDVYSIVVAIDVASGQEKPIGSQTFPEIREVAWLPDGSGLLMTAVDKSAAARSIGPAGSQIWQLSYPEGEPHRITNDLSDFRTISLAAESNTFVTMQFEAPAAVWVAPPADAAARARPITSGRRSVRVRWTPDNKIVFESDASGSNGIWTMDADGGNQRQLTTEDAAAPTVSADGSLIAFTSTPTSTSHISLMDADGGNVRQLTNGKGEFAATFSPDDKWVLYVSREARKRTLWRVPVEGGAPSQITDKPSFGPRVSPDGKWLAAGYHEQPTAAKVAIMPFDGGVPVKILDIPMGIGTQDFQWTPDGRALIYIVTQDEVSNLWQQPVEGGEPKQLTDFKTDLIFSFDYSRDGKQLVLSRGVYSRNVVLFSDSR